tara:strand:- start:2196 stop:3785 length:1590 start_codon:yes stop_codon:yes gene_type:complete
LGVVLEDALCELLMMHPPEVSSFEELKAWAASHVSVVAQQAMATGEKMWNEVLWKSSEDAWNEVDVSSLEERLLGGLSLFFEEVKACFDQDGGPYLQLRRTGQQPFSVPEPAQGTVPVFPLPDKVRDVEKRAWSSSTHPTWSPSDAPITWHEAWECARPWFKDPRVHQPQRLYHPEGWASGELDMVLRWDGHIRIVDIKSGSPGSAFASSLEHQLRFYAWLWHETHDGQTVNGMEGWYLDGGHRVAYGPPLKGEMEGLSSTFNEHHRAMQDAEKGVKRFPVSPSEACQGEAAGCGWCAVARSDDGVWSVPEHLSWVSTLPEVSMKAPYAALGDVQGRVAVKGRLTGAWGPMPNHFAEPVLGAVLVVGQQHITVEESEPGAFSQLHEHMEQEVVLVDALPGVWRDQPRLYVDSRTTLYSGGEAENVNLPELTRLGLLRTRANVKGHVIGIRRRSGTRIDGKPWSMLSLMLWDGHHVAEVVAFGASISQRLLSLRPGDGVAMTGVELGWRSGLLQLRIDNRKTRLETFSQR